MSLTQTQDRGTYRFLASWRDYISKCLLFPSHISSDSLKLSFGSAEFLQTGHLMRSHLYSLINLRGFSLSIRQHDQNLLIVTSNASEHPLPSPLKQHYICSFSGSSLPKTAS